MLKIDEDTISRIEQKYPGIREQLLQFEGAILPACSRCGSEDTADVQVGVIGRTINLAAATTKFKLIPNGPKDDTYFCNTCEKFFGPRGKSRKRRSEKRKPAGGGTVTMESLTNIEGITAFYRDITGRDPTPEDLANTRAILKRSQEQEEK